MVDVDGYIDCPVTTEHQIHVLGVEA